MAINKLESNGVQYAVEPNSILKKIDAPYGFWVFRWTVQKSGNTQEWYGLAKVARDVFDCLAELARSKQSETAASCAQSCFSFCGSITKATIIPFLLGSIDKLIFPETKDEERTDELWVNVGAGIEDLAFAGADVGQKLLKVALAVALVGRVTLGLAVFATPLNYIMLVHYSVDIVKQGYRLYKVYQLQQGFNAATQAANQSETDPSKRINQQNLIALVNREKWMQPLRVVDAVVSLAGEAFSQMCPAFKLVNTTVGALTSVYSMGLNFFEETQCSWKFKLLY